MNTEKQIIFVFTALAQFVEKQQGLIVKSKESTDRSHLKLGK